MKKTISLTIAEPLLQKLFSHLFPGDYDEHGAVIVAGIAETSGSIKLLAREILLAQDGQEYIPGKFGYRALTAKFVAEKSGYCADQSLCYLAVHCHGGYDTVSFSQDDIDSHERGYPALLDITNGGPVGAIVFAQNAVAGDIWFRDKRYELDYVTVIGSKIRKIQSNQFSKPQKYKNTKYDRNSRLFGDIGQEILSKLKVGIVGLGGGGSIINELISRLGIGSIVAIDFDRIELSNLPRVVGATEKDALANLTLSKNPFLRNLGNKFSKRKVHIAERVAKAANPKINYEAVVGNILDERTAKKLVDADFIFLATDNIQSRLVFNALVHQYLIPGAQIGIKPVLNKSKEIEHIQIASRLVLPFPNGGCLNCNNLIPPMQLAIEGLPEKERLKRQYIEDIAEPSVITLNAISAARVTNDLMMLFTGLYKENTNLAHLMEFADERKTFEQIHQFNKNCPDCGESTSSNYAKGDRARLPCRENS